MDEIGATDDRFPDDIILAYIQFPGGQKQIGRVLINSGQLNILEDWYGLLGHIPEGPCTDVTAAIINGTGAPLRLVSQGAILAGMHLDMVPEKVLSKPLQPQNVTPDQIAAAPAVPDTSTFHYLRAGMIKPVVLESNPDGILYDGNPLEEQEIQLILANLQNGKATIRHAGSQMLGKSELLIKATPSESLAHLEKLQAENPHLDLTSHITGLRKQIFEDNLVEGIGNKYAWNQLKAANAPGAYGSMDLNHFKQINDTYGHDAGDSAIKAAGNAMKAAAEKVGDIKLARNGGDEFAFHAKDLDTAHRFARELRNQMDLIPHVGGTHRISASVGIGHDYESADKVALPAAKQQKHGHSLTGMPTVLAHSVHKEGNVGPLPTSSAGLDRPAPQPDMSGAMDTKPSTAVQVPKAPKKPVQPKTEPQPQQTMKSTVDELRSLAETAVDFRRAGLEVDFSEILKSLNAKLIGKIAE